MEAASSISRAGAASPRLLDLRTKLSREDDSGGPWKPISTLKPDDNNRPSAPVILPYKNYIPPASFESSADPIMDSHGRQHTYLRVSLTDLCNLRCTYCMPKDGIPNPLDQDQRLSDEEIVRLSKLWMGTTQGKGKIRLTGGEPTLRRELPSLIGRLNDLEPKGIGITTNGITLSRHITDLVENGLTNVNISIDTLDSKRFAAITRRDALHKVIRGVKSAANAMSGGVGSIKINCVVQRGVNDSLEDFQSFLEFQRDNPVDIRFIEYMPFNSNEWAEGEKFVPLVEMLSKLSTLAPVAPLPSAPNDTTRWYSSGNVGRIGIIASMSNPFCGTCNRIRITGDGSLKVCLFSNSEVSLRDAMRDGVSDRELEGIVRGVLAGKKWAFDGAHDMFDLAEKSSGNRPMTTIGG